MVLIRPDRDGSNKFNMKPVLIRDFSEEYSGIEFKPNF